MSTAKIAITLEESILKKIDSLVRKHLFPNRSRAIQIALSEKLARMNQIELARECAKLDVKFERALADEGLGTEGDEWPEY